MQVRSSRRAPVAVFSALVAAVACGGEPDAGVDGDGAVEVGDVDARLDVRPDGEGGPEDVGEAGADDEAADVVDVADTFHPPAVSFGYYRVDRVPSGGACHAETVRAWTDLAYVDWNADARAFDYPEGTDMSPLRAAMDGILQRVTDAGLDVMMDVSYGSVWGPRLTRQGILETATPYWERVRFIILGDELDLSPADAADALDQFRTAMRNLSLPERPIGVTLTPDYVLGRPEMLGAGWDFIAIEAYTPSCSCGSCGPGTAEEEIAVIADHVAQQEAIIPADVDLVLILQGYDRNGAFANVDTLAEINRASYFRIVRDNPRYKAMVVFNWEREGSSCETNPYPDHGHGTSGLPQLQAVHQEIWRDLTTR